MTAAHKDAPGMAVALASPHKDLREQVWAESYTTYANPETEHALYSAELSDDVDRPDDAYLSWPYPALDDLYGRRFPGEIVGIAGYSGHGKSTFALSYLEEQTWDAIPTVYLGTEIKGKHVKAHLIARLLRRFGLASIHPGDLIKGYLSDLDKKLVKACALWFDHGGFWETDAEERELGLLFPKRVIPHARLLRSAPFSSMSERATRSAFEWCAANLFAEVVIDHVDQIEDKSGGAGTYEASVRAMQMLHKCAQGTNVCATYLSQLNNEGMRGPGSDPLRVHFPPTPEQVALGGHKRMISDGMLGIFRPLIPAPSKGDGVAMEEYKERMKAAREARDTSRVVMPFTMGIVVMKDRAYGRERQICYLNVAQGSRLEPFPDDLLSAYEHGNYGFVDWWFSERMNRHSGPPAMAGAPLAEVQAHVANAVETLPDVDPFALAPGDRDLLDL